MATNVQQIRDFSWVSQASYLDLTQLERDGARAAFANRLINNDLASHNVFAPNQATQFTATESGFTFQSHRPNDVTGFSGAVFKHADGSFVFAVRGTEASIRDLAIADLLGIALSGAARSQTISAYRYLKQLMTPGGQSVSYSNQEKLQLAGLHTASFNPLVTAVGYVAISAMVAGDKGLGEAGSTIIPPGARINFTGHSLGGHVALLVSQLAAKSGSAQVGELVTYNAPGLGGIPAEVLSWFGVKGADFVNPSTITNVISQAWPDLTAGLGFTGGRREDIFIEKQLDPIAKHSIVKLSDSLALYDLYQRLDSTLRVSDIGTVLRATAGDMADRLEAGLDTLRRVFLGVTTPATKPVGSPDNRAIFYSNLDALTKHPQFAAIADDNGDQAERARVISLLGLNAAQLASEARSDFAKFFSLFWLSPVALSNANGLYQQADPTLFTRWQQDSLPAPNVARNFSESWLRDRAGLLEAALYANIRDDASTFIPGTGNVTTEYHYYVEGKERIVFATPSDVDASKPLRNHVVAFADDTINDTIEGTDSALGDRLYGGARVDLIRGGKGDDYLEGNGSGDILEGGDGNDTLVGGAGDDTLKGGNGLDIYVVGSGEDDITDADGSGIVMDSNGVRIAGLFVKDGSRYVFADDPTIVATLNSPLTIRLANGASVIVNGFDEGELGIHLTERPDPDAPPPAVAHTLTADSDYFTGGPHTGGFSVFGLDGNDHLSVGEFVLTGDELLDQEPVLIEGGAGSDVAAGTGDNDRLFGGTRSDLTALLAPEETLEGLDRDVLVGLRGDDLIVGGGGADWLVGGRGEDTIYAGPGDDIIAGGGTVYEGSYWYQPDLFPLEPGTVFPVLQDTLILNVDLTDASLTNEAILAFEATGRVIRGQFEELRERDDDDGADTVFAGLGNDEVWAGWGDDYVDGGAGVDTIIGEEGDDTLFGGDGDDSLFGDGEAMLPENHGADYLDGEAGNDTLVGGGGEDTLFGGDDDDRLFGDSDLIDSEFHADDYLDGEDGDDQLIGHGGNDQLFGGAGIDALYGGDGNDYLEGEDGADTLTGEFGEDELFGGDGDDELSGGDDADYLEGEEGADRLFGEAGEDTLVGGPGNDELLGGSENDTLYGGSGIDDIAGEDGDDLLSGGADADTLRGGSGNDTYLIVHGDDRDTIIDTDGENRIRFMATAGPADLTITQLGTGSDFSIAYGSATDEVIVTGGLSGSIRTFEFVDGTVYTLKEVLDVADADPMTIAGSGSGATFYGGSSDDTLTAGLHDRLHGGRGNDTLHGSSDFSTLEFSRGDGHDLVRGSASRAFVFDASVSRNSLIASRADPLDAETLTPRDLVLTYGDPSAPDTIALQDNARTPSQIYWFNDGRLTHVQLLERSGLALEWLGSTDNESVTGTRFGDRLSGEGGDDTLQGREGDDELLGGAGHDELMGGSGNDVLVAGIGVDTLQGEAGDDRYIVRAGDGLDMIVDSDGDNLVEFDAGVTLAGLDAELVNGTDANLYLAVHYTPTDTLLVRQNFGAFAGDGTLTFSFADGTRLTEAQLSSLKFDAPLDFRGTTQAIRMTGSGFDDTLVGSTADDRLEGGDGNDRIAGDQGRDALFGGAGDDLLVGNAGDDVLEGGTGADTYRLHRGMGKDTIVERAGDMSILVLSEGLAASDLAHERLDDDLYVHIANSRDGVRIANYFEPGSSTSSQSWEVRYPDGTSTSLETLIGALPETVRPASVEELMSDFRLRAQTFHESELIGDGYERQPDGSFVQHTTFSSNDFSSHRVTTLQFAFPTQVNDAPSISRATVARQTVSNTFTSSTTQQTIQQLNTAGSHLVPLGAGGNLSGTAGAPGYVVVSGSSTSIGQPGNVVVALPPNIASTDPFSGAQQSYPPGGFRVYPANTTPQYSTRTIPHRHTEQASEERFNIETITAGAASSVIRAGWPAIVDGGGGNDRIDGHSFFVMREPGEPGVLLYGNAGDDALGGSNFEDVLIGGPGTDTLWGGASNDLYVVLAGAGIDEIIEDGASIGTRENVLRLPQGATLENLSFAWSEELRSFGDPAGSQFAAATPKALHAILTLSWGDTDAARVVVPHSDDGWTGIDFVEFADGQRISFGELVSRSPADLNPHHRDNVLSGSGAIDGGPGDDTIEADTAFGGSGSDTLHSRFAAGDEGSDALVGTNGSDALIGGTHIGPILVGSFSLGSFWGEEGDTFHGGRGDDEISASAGTDTFEFELGDGYDTVRDLQHDNLYFYYGGSFDTLLPDLSAAAQSPEDRLALHQNIDALAFGAGIAPADIEVVREAAVESEQPDALLFRHRNEADAVRFAHWYSTDAVTGGPIHNQLGRVEFADGTVWDRDTITTLAANAPRELAGSAYDDFIRGTAVDEVIESGDGTDWLAGGKGDDVLDGGADDDTYFFEPGDGVDTLRESGVGSFDVLQFGSGITPEDLTLGLGSLLIRVSDTGEAIRIEGFDPADALGSGVIEAFEFADGQSLNYAQLLERGFDIEGSFADDTLSGTSVNDRMSGLSGDDVLASGDGDDTLDGGSGSDRLEGGSGDDTYRFGIGSGDDHIEDGDGTLDAIVLGGGMDPAAVNVARSGAVLMLTFDGFDDSLEIRQQNGFGIEELRFRDGTVWDAATLESHVVSGNTAPAVSLPIADATIDEDSLLSLTLPANTFSDAGDTLTLSAALIDGSPLPAWLSFDAVTRTFSGTARNDDVGAYEITVTANDSGGLTVSDAFVVTVRNTNDAPALEQSLDDMTTVERQPFTFAVPATVFEDVDAADILTYEATLATGGPLPAWLAFDPVTRTFSGTPGEDDVRTFPIRVTATDAPGTDVSDDFDLQVSPLPGITLTGSEGADNLAGSPGADVMQGLGGPDKLYGHAGQDAIFGGGGNDYLAGGTGHDLLIAGAGNDALLGEDGSDALYGDAGSDALWGGRGADALYGGDDIDVLAGDDGEDLLDGGAGNDIVSGGKDADILHGGTGNDALSGDAGNDLLYGEGNDDTLLGWSGNDLLDGGAGNDNLDGGADNDFLAGAGGSDTVRPGGGRNIIAFNRGDGIDTVHATGTAEDTLSMGGGIRYADLKLAKSGHDLVLNAGAGERITLKDWYASTPLRSVERLQVVVGATPDFDAASSNPLFNRKVQTFDFERIVGSFDAARAANPKVSSWSMAPALAISRVLGSDTEAWGGTLAHEFAIDGSLDHVPEVVAQNVLGDARFGLQPQPFASEGSAMTVQLTVAEAPALDSGSLRPAEGAQMVSAPEWPFSGQSVERATSSQDAIERWLDQTAPAPESAGNPHHGVGASDTELEIAAAWRRTQRLLDAHLQNGAADEPFDGALPRTTPALSALPHAANHALARVSDHRLTPLGGLQEGFNILSA